ncbi:MAG TPA: inorganic diphosphatase [Puia sp.]|jgi:inorganic pyrophosphatase|nr:inorganic diphosphatase [Puia sp.]
MKLNNIKPAENGQLQVVVETPKGSAHKYDYDRKKQIFQLNKIMPMGMVFPYDFGFIPGTKGGDGDPLDVLILMDSALIQGSLICCRPLALLEAVQQERDKSKERNDRIIATSVFSPVFTEPEKFIAEHSVLLHQIETFFIEYNKLAGKEFKPVRWKGPKAVFNLVSESR